MHRESIVLSTVISLHCVTSSAFGWAHQCLIPSFYFSLCVYCSQLQNRKPNYEKIAISMKVITQLPFTSDMIVPQSLFFNAKASWSFQKTTFVSTYIYNTWMIEWNLLHTYMLHPRKGFQMVPKYPAHLTRNFSFPFLLTRILITFSTKNFSCSSLLILLFVWLAKSPLFTMSGTLLMNAFLSSSVITSGKLCQMRD